MEVELLHLSVIEGAHLVVTRIHDPDLTSLFMGGQAIGIDTKVLDLARESMRCSEQSESQVSQQNG
jgi:hypothetical protein